MFINKINEETYKNNKKISLALITISYLCVSRECFVTILRAKRRRIIFV